MVWQGLYCGNATADNGGTFITGGNVTVTALKSGLPETKVGSFGANWKNRRDVSTSDTATTLRLTAVPASGCTFLGYRPNTDDNTTLIASRVLDVAANQYYDVRAEFTCP